MGDINRNNFLRWSGAMTETLPQVVAVDDAVLMLQGINYIDFDPLTNDTANLGIDTLSLVVVSVSDSSAPLPRWNEANGMLRIYRPTVGTPPQMTVTYYFKDFLGNSSNIATILVSLTLLSTGWRGYTPSLFCVQNTFGQNTSYRQYGQLEKYYPTTGTAFIPQLLKPNTIGDPNYIAPVINTTACPLPSTIPFIIYNNTSGLNTITINALQLTLGSNPLQNYPTNVTPGGSVQIMVPIGFYTLGSILFTHTGTVSTIVWEYHYGPGGVGSITGFLGSGSSFDISNPTVSGTAVVLTIN